MSDFINRKYKCKCSDTFDCKFLLSSFCQKLHPSECRNSEKVSKNINEYINDMSVDTKADFLSEIIACARCPKHLDCEAKKDTEEYDQDKCYALIKEWLVSKVKE